MARAASAPFWNPDARLGCLDCGETFPTGPSWFGCPTCGGPLVVVYAPTVGRQSLVDPARILDLGQGCTPLLAAGELGERLWFKVEGQNPTGSHKDRFHAMSLTVARELGYEAVVAASTGNHGVACAAYAARVNLRCLVCLHPEAPDAVRTQIAAHGGEMAVVPGEVHRVIGTLVAHGWYPSTGADPHLAGCANPYGQEGYKAIAWEITDQLGHMPEVVAVPAASGDTLFGLWRGFSEQASAGNGAPPTLLACQPAGAAPLVVTARDIRLGPQTVSHPRSLALSARDPRSGWHATRALQEGGLPLAVEEPAMVDAVRRLARAGLFVEPSSALALAGLEQARREGLVDPAGAAVVVLTSSGSNWTRDLETACGGPPAVATSADELLEALGAT